MNPALADPMQTTQTTQTTPSVTAGRQTCCSVPIRAIAIAHEKSNAIGTVELCCTAKGLSIQFVRVSVYTEGYVPYPATSSERIVVPFEQVARVELDGEGLVHLTLDPSATPYNRMALAGLARNPKLDHAASYRHRTRIERNVTVAALAAWVPLALVLRAVFPELSSVIAIGMPVSLCLILHLVRRDIASRLVLFSRSADRVRDELLSELRFRLAPGVVRSGVSAAEVHAFGAVSARANEQREAGVGSLRGLFATAGVMAVLTAVAILIGKNLLFSSTPDPRAAWSDRGDAREESWAAMDSVSNVASSIGPDPTPVVPPPPPCVCDRADSPLWADGIPRMSVLTHNRPGTTSYDKPSVYPEVAIVNNSSEDLRDVAMVLNFWLGPRDGLKARVVDTQDLFWEGRLGPGKAVKWRATGRGDDFTVTSFIDGTIGQDAKAAPADAFYKLSMTANTPSVRAHGTMMLAYLGDERVEEGLDRLRQEGREELADTVQKIALASQSLRVCAVESGVDPSDSDRLVVKACVYNAGSVQAPRPWITAIAKLGSSSTEGRWGLPEDLRPRSGLITSGTVSVPVVRDDESDVGAAVVVVEAGR